MIYRNTIHILILFCTLIVSCTERIDIKLDDNYIRLVVDGAISTDSMAHTVILSKTSDYYYNKPAPMVTGATVSISDGVLSFPLKEELPGVYRTTPAVHGVTGKTYTLNISLATQIGGYTQYTANSTIQPVNRMDSVGLQFHPDWSEGGFWEVKCYVQDPPTVDFYRFLISRNDKMLTDTLNEWFVTDDKYFNGSYTNGAAIAYLRQDSPKEGLSTGDKITVELNSIGKDYADFLWAAQSELYGSNPLFSGPQANVRGNISNGAVGFFAAYSATRSYTITPKIN
jgi:hypothetical protein